MPFLDASIKRIISDINGLIILFYCWFEVSNTSPYMSARRGYICCPASFLCLEIFVALGFFCMGASVPMISVVLGTYIRTSVDVDAITFCFSFWYWLTCMVTIARSVTRHKAYCWILREFIWGGLRFFANCFLTSVATDQSYFRNKQRKIYLVYCWSEYSFVRTQMWGGLVTSLRNHAPLKMISTDLP